MTNKSDKKTSEYWLNKVRESALALIRYVPEPMRTEALCLAAVKSRGYALAYVPESMRTEALCLTAVQKWAFAIVFVPESLRDRVKAAVKNK